MTWEMAAADQGARHVHHGVVRVEFAVGAFNGSVIRVTDSMMSTPLIAPCHRTCVPDQAVMVRNLPFEM